MKSFNQEARYIANRLKKQRKIEISAVCSKCGESPKPHIRCNGRKQSLLEMHHPNHKEPSVVIWLCSRCHRTLHQTASSALDSSKTL